MTLERPAQAGTPIAMSGLHLPPTFVTDHCLRTLFYRDAMSPVDLALHWRVGQELAVEIVESLKAAGLVGADAGQTTFERHARVHLTAAGQEQLARARQRTWYSGALPVSARDFAERAWATPRAVANADQVRSALAELSIDRAVADELGQAVSASDTIAVSGAAADEQPALAHALGGALAGNVALPYALYVAGAVIRVFDPRHHHVPREADADDQTNDVLRSRQDDPTQWMDVRRPVVTLAGGVLDADVAPAFDEDARFYLAPPPLIAFGGLFAVFDADGPPGQLDALARLWLIPGKVGVGVVLLRSGERIEVPWRASTLLFVGEASAVLAASGAVAYRVDIAQLDADGLRAVLASRLASLAPASDVVDALATILEQQGDTTRIAAASAARYLLDRAAYEGSTGSVASALGDAAAFAQIAPRARPPRLRLAS